MRVLSLILVFGLIFDYGEAAKILGVFPMPAHSHFTVGYRLMKELADRGHEVTMISPYPQKNPPKNYRDVSLASNIEAFAKKYLKDILLVDNWNLVLSLPFLYSMGYTVTETTLNHPEVQKLCNSNEQFDLVIMEQFLNEAHTYFAHHFKAPLILVSAVGSGSWTNHYVGNPAPSSHVPSLFWTASAKMTFYERIINSFIKIYDELYRNMFMIPKQNEILHKYFPDAPHLNDLMRNVSLILLNSHSSTNEPVPHVPNMIEIGGYHVNPTGNMPKDIKDFLDEASEGVVYFCMGSNIKSSAFPEDKQQVFLKAFSKLKMKVLWKFELDSIRNQPKNVKLVKWAPQQDILVHPNVKLFISHGGLLGSIEAVYAGVPMIGIPIFGDQKMNIATAVKRGYALSISFADLTEGKLTDTINEILDNKKYTENAKARSKIMHDRVVKPIDEAIHWIEYVMRHPGATHFRSAAMDLNWIQYNLIDVIAFLAAVVAILISIAYYTCRRLLCSKAPPGTSKDKKTK